MLVDVKLADEVGPVVLGLGAGLIARGLRGQESGAAQLGHLVDDGAGRDAGVTTFLGRK